MTKEELKVQLADFRKFAEKYLKIKNKAGQIVPLILNKAQLKVLIVIEKMLSEGKPIRVIILKARQKGVSTLIEAYIFWRETFKKNRKAAVVAHETDGTNNMWEMMNRYYDNLPGWLKPQKKYHNAKELTYAKTKSEIMFWTAEKGDVGSSHTVQDCHLTELSKWRDPKTTLTALLQTIPDLPNTFICIESTAKGFGGEFHDRWIAAKKGESNYVPIFYSWLEDDEYTVKFDNDREKEDFRKSLDETEIALLKRGGTLEHLKWRRKIGLPDKCGDDPDIFKQEYPSDDIECFLMSGRPVFDTKICNDKYNRDIRPIMIGDLEPVYDKSLKYNEQISTGRTSYYDLLPFLKEVKFIENPKGFIKIYSKIKIEEGEYNRFAAGVDTSEGLEQGDYDVIKIIDRQNSEKGGRLDFPITWHGHLGMDEFAVEIHKLQKYLKDKIQFAIEKNNTGHAVIISAYKLGVNLYYAEDYNKGYPQTTDSIGFRTTRTADGGGTKPEVISNLNEWIREGYFEDYEKEFWEEALTFVKDAKGRMAAQDKLKNPGVRCFDDRIIASALSIKCHLWMPPYKKSDVKPLPDWFIKAKARAKNKNEISVMGV